MFKTGLTGAVRPSFISLISDSRRTSTIRNCYIKTEKDVRIKH